MIMERTYLMVKPDGVQRGLCGEIVSRFEKKGLKLIAMKLMVIPKETAENHYGEHKGKKFYDSLISYITSGPVLAMVWEGENAVSICRNMMGKTNPAESAPSGATTEWSPVSTSSTDPTPSSPQRGRSRSSSSPRSSSPTTGPPTGGPTNKPFIS